MVCNKSNQREVTTHRMLTKRRKYETLPSKALLLNFKRVAKAKIPQLLGMFSVIAP